VKIAARVWSSFRYRRNAILPFLPGVVAEAGIVASRTSEASGTTDMTLARRCMPPPVIVTKHVRAGSRHSGTPGGQVCQLQCLIPALRVTQCLRKSDARATSSGGLDRRLAVRRGLSVRPVTRGDAEARDPVHVETALRAVEGEVLELALEVGLHLEESRSIFAWTLTG
jgi:hypothetical protein